MIGSGFEEWKSTSKAREAKRRLWLLRRAKKEARRKKRIRRRTGSGWLPGDLLKNCHTTKNTSRFKEGVTIDLPEAMDFEENYESTVSHLINLRRATRGRVRLKYLGFQNLRYISPAAALVLASEVDRWNRRIGHRLRASVDSWHPDIERLLFQMGYFDLLGIKSPVEDHPARSTTFLPFKRGLSGSEEGGRLAKELRVEIESMVGSSVHRQALFEGLSEAITNVGQHAYPPSASGGLRLWWLSASFDADSNRLCVMFFDHGEGIPATLPANRKFESLKEFFKVWTDSKKLEAAMEVGRSSTGRSERGKGLQNLIHFAKSHLDGQLSIYSLCGRYRMEMATGSDAVPRVSRRDFENPLGGTLIEWSVRLK